MGGGGANQPLINSLNTLPKNSNPKELAKNLKKIQNSNQLDLNHLNELKDLKSDSNLKSTFKESTIKSVMDKNQTSNKQNKNLNEIQEINYSRDSKKLNSIKLESKIKESNFDLNLQKDSKIQSKTISKNQYFYYYKYSTFSIPSSFT